MKREKKHQAAIKQAVAQNIMVIVCPECNSEHTLSKVSRKKPVKDYVDVFEVGIECPDCNEWTHSFFTNKGLQEMRQALDKAAALLSAANTGKLPTGSGQNKEVIRRSLLKNYKKKKRSFADSFNSYNKMMRKKIGIAVPKGIDDQ